MRVVETRSERDRRVGACELARARRFTPRRGCPGARNLAPSRHRRRVASAEHRRVRATSDRSSRSTRSTSSPTQSARPHTCPSATATSSQAALPRSVTHPFASAAATVARCSATSAADKYTPASRRPCAPILTVVRESPRQAARSSRSQCGSSSITELTPDMPDITAAIPDRHTLCPPQRKLRRVDDDPAAWKGNRRRGGVQRSRPRPLTAARPSPPR